MRFTSRWSDTTVTLGWEPEDGDTLTYGPATLVGRSARFQLPVEVGPDDVHPDVEALLALLIVGPSCRAPYPNPMTAAAAGRAGRGRAPATAAALRRNAVRRSGVRFRGVIAGVLVALMVTSLVAGCAGSRPEGSVTIVPPDQVVTSPPGGGPSPGTGSPGTGSGGSAAPILPDADGAARALRAFGTLARDPGLSYRVTATLIEHYEPKPITTVFTAEVSGADYRGSAKSGRNTVGFAYVGGQAWAKPNKDPWFHLAIHQTQADDVVRPWETLCWFNDLTFTGRPDEPSDGYAFECPSGYSFQNRRLRSVGAHGRIDVLTLVVDAAGVPVTLHVEGEHPSLAGRATPFTLDVRFQDVGKPTTIKAP